MNRFRRRIVLSAILLFTVFTMAVIALSRIGVEEPPPCRACGQPPSSDLPQMSVCELANNTQKIAGTAVRVTAELKNDSGQLFLKNAGCTMHAGFAKENQACQGVWRKLQVTCGVNSWYDGSASVRVVGSVSTIPVGNYYAGDEGFVISCLEEVLTVPGLGLRIKFALGRLFWP